MNKVTGVSLDPQGSPAQLVSLMDNDHSLKKTGCYVNAGKARKSLEAFTIQHAGLGKVDIEFVCLVACVSACSPTG